jgi:hypothetical protein
MADHKYHSHESEQPGRLPEFGWSLSRRAALVTGIYADRPVTEGRDHPVWVTGAAGIDRV